MIGQGIEELLARLERGEVAAAEDLYVAYAAYVRAVVRRRISTQLRCKFDSADIAQSVWAQVVRQIGAGWHVDTEPELRALLAVIARRRVATRARAHARPGEPVSESILNEVVAAHQPTPSQVVHADELWERLLLLCSPEHRDVLRLRRDGLPLAEVAARTGFHEGSIRRILRRLFREIAMNEQPTLAVADPGTGA